MKWNSRRDTPPRQYSLWRSLSLVPSNMANSSDFSCLTRAASFSSGNVNLPCTWQLYDLILIQQVNNLDKWISWLIVTFQFYCKRYIACQAEFIKSYYRQSTRGVTSAHWAVPKNKCSLKWLILLIRVLSQVLCYLSSLGTLLLRVVRQFLEHESPLSICVRVAPQTITRS